MQETIVKVSTAIPGMRRVTSVDANAAAADWRLSAADLVEIDAVIAAAKEG